MTSRGSLHLAALGGFLSLLSQLASWSHTEVYIQVIQQRGPEGNCALYEKVYLLFSFASATCWLQLMPFIACT